MTRQEAIQEQIDEVMDEFAFGKVAAYMKSVNWTWFDTKGVPSEAEIRRNVRKIMYRLAERNEASYFSGGILVELVENKDEQWLRFDVKFVMENWSMDGTSYQ